MGGWRLPFGAKANWKQGACLCAPGSGEPTLQGTPFLTPSLGTCVHAIQTRLHPTRRAVSTARASVGEPAALGMTGCPSPVSGAARPPLRTGFARERATYLTYWLRGSHWLCHPGRSADGSRCPLCSRGCQSGVLRASTGHCSAPSRFPGCPGRPRGRRQRKARSCCCSGGRGSLPGSSPRRRVRVALWGRGASPLEPRRWGSGGWGRGGGRTSSFFQPRGS